MRTIVEDKLASIRKREKDFPLSVMRWKCLFSYYTVSEEKDVMVRQFPKDVKVEELSDMNLLRFFEFILLRQAKQM